MDYWRNNTIWFDQLPKSLFHVIDLKEAKLKKVEKQDVEYLILWHHKINKLGNFVDIPENFRYLELNWSNIQNFIGLEKFNKLKRLELHYCTKLHSDNGLAKVADTLEHLHINQSKKFVPAEELFSLRNLRVLCLNSCGDIESLKFLNEFPNLIDFRFVDTNVSDGDLTPIIEHPTIRSVGFLNKRHYNVSEEEIGTILIQKNGAKEFKTKIQKEGTDFSTFRYIY
ncbi:hypothetical protein PAECIP111891_02447 [Paenibacillus allorhizoplanae]|uniref:Leucine-rich repeat domain-containing protein n=1 Tax=Paenibacillus allorhizoplanae TaxID=2905648 RepID=A0ABN8GDB4_9BACL|nr:hypothetical protein [Paenibacillus allorhizoplanae]CAH1203849.1 hypothetical protein PAECIP111891_02447 [Paenibacillus allorhizoplanae]